MIDSLLIFRELSPNEYRQVITTLNLVTKKDNNSNIIKHHVKVNNLRLVISPIHLIINGSISKFYTNSYLTNFTRQGIEKAIRTLENRIGINLDTAFVYKLELSQLIFLDMPISYYFEIFNKMNYCKRRQYNTSLIFYNKRKSISIYDKKELISKSNKYKGLESDKSLSYLNTIAKVEIRLKNKVKHQLTQFYKKQYKKGIKFHFDNYEYGTSLTIKDLYYEDTYNFLYSYWLNTVLEIKINKDKVNTAYYKEFISKIKNTYNYYR